MKHTSVFNNSAVPTCSCGHDESVTLVQQTVSHYANRMLPIWWCANCKQTWAEDMPDVDNYARQYLGGDNVANRNNVLDRNQQFVEYGSSFESSLSGYIKGLVDQRIRELSQDVTNQIGYLKDELTKKVADTVGNLRERVMNFELS